MTSLVFGERRPNGASVAHRFHELVGDVDAVVQVQRFAVEVAGRLADFEELLDFRVVDVEIAGRRPAAQRALAEIASVSESITRMKGMMPEVCPFALTFSPIERTPPQ